MIPDKWRNPRVPIELDATLPSDIPSESNITTTGTMMRISARLRLLVLYYQALGFPYSPLARLRRAVSDLAKPGQLSLSLGDSTWNETSGPVHGFFFGTEIEHGYLFDLRGNRDVFAAP
jgi:hypothetical protein